MAFDENKYKAIFEQRYGKGSFEAGLSQAREIGRLQVLAEKAKQDYADRLKAAKIAKEQGSDGGISNLFEKYKQYLAEKDQYNSPTPRIDDYYKHMMDNVQQPIPRKNPYTNPNVQQLLPPMAPADNPNLSPWDKINLLGR